MGIDVVYRTAIVGFGKIAEEQHHPVISRHSSFEVSAVVSRRGVSVDGLPGFASVSDLVSTGSVDAVAICTPPVAHFDDAQTALQHGLHVLLEKPPTLSLGELSELERLADENSVTLFTTWHSQHNPAVDALRDRLQDVQVNELAVTWKEDVKLWHPGQKWIWQPGGFGIFDPGINALSILTKILPGRVFLRSAILDVPSNSETPIAAHLRLGIAGRSDLSARAEFDWRHTGPQTWDIDISTDTAHYRLIDGGRVLQIDGDTVINEPSREYELIYDRFAALIDGACSEVDSAPFRLVADAFMIGCRRQTEPFTD